MPIRYAENTEDGHSKFYAVGWLPGKQGWYSHYGKIGQNGTYQFHSASSPQGAMEAALKKIGTKLSRGYAIRAPLKSLAIPPGFEDIYKEIGKPWVKAGAGLEGLAVIDVVNEQDVVAKKAKARAKRQGKKKAQEDMASTPKFGAGTVRKIRKRK